MARYAVASGNWNDTAVWSATDGGAPGASFPVDGDPVFFTAASGAITVTVNVSSAATSIDATGFTGTFTGASALQLKGNCKAVAGCTWTYTGTLTEALTAGTATLTSAGKTLCGNLTMNGAGGTVTFADAFVTTGTCTLTAGTWNDGSQNLTMAAWTTGSGTGVRVTTYGEGNVWYITGAGTCWDVGRGTNSSSNINLFPTCSVNFTYAGASARTISTTYNGNNHIPHCKISAGSGTVLLDKGAGAFFMARGLDFTGYTGAATFNGTDAQGGALDCSGGDLVLAPSPATFANTGGGSCTFAGSVTYVPTVYINCNGNTWPGAFAIIPGSGVTVVLSGNFACSGALRFGEDFGIGGTFSASTFNISTPTFSSSATTTRTLNAGSGTWTLTSTAATTVWNMATTTGLTLNPGTATIALTGVTANTRTISANSVQLPSIAVNAGSGAVTFTNVNCDSLTFGNSYSGTIANQTITIRGNVQLSNHASFALTAGANAWTLAATSTGKTFTSQGKTIDFPLTFNGVGGGWTMQDAVSHGITRTMTLVNGALSFGTGLTHTMGFFSSSNANVRTIDSGTSTLNFPTTGTVWDTSTSTNLTMAGTGTIALTANSATARTITGGGVALPSLLMAVGSYAPTFTSCNFLSFTNTAGWSGTLANQTLTIRGSISLSSAGTYSSGSNTWTWACASGSALFTMNGKTLAWPLSVSAAGGQHFFADVPVFSAATTVTGAGPLGAQDNFTMPAVGTWTFTGPWTYAPTGAGKFVTFNALLPTTGTITVNGSGSIVFQDAPPAMSQANAFTVTAGGLDTGNFNVTAYSLTFSGSGVRTLTLGSSTVTLTGTGTVLDASGTNQTVNAGTSVVTQTDGTSTLKTMYLGGKTWAAVRGKKSGTNRLKLVPGGGVCDYAWAA